jgi:hypothetical protein
MDIGKCNCGATEMEVAENQYFDEAIHHRGTARCIPLTDVADYAQLAALRDERDRAVRVIRCVMEHFFESTDGEFYPAYIEDVPLSFEPLLPGDFDWLRHLIESEEGQ